MTDIQEIRPQLFIGNLSAASDTSVLKKLGIKFLLSLCPVDVPLEVVEQKLVQVLDLSEEDLLSHFPECISRIDQEKKSGSVLIHCQAGTSRSVAILAAYLMSTEKLTVSEALQSIRKCWPSASPNDGFLEQLELFFQMGYKIDKDNIKYKSYRLRHLARSFEDEGTVEASSLALDPALSPALSTSHNRTISMYRCKKCRRALASVSSILPHVQKSENSATSNQCSSLFLEPVQWMAPALQNGEISGKFLCPSCGNRVGSFQWHGQRCTCNEWIVPAFQLHSSKVDPSWQ